MGGKGGEGLTGIAFRRRCANQHRCCATSKPKSRIRARSSRRRASSTSARITRNTLYRCSAYSSLHKQEPQHHGSVTGCFLPQSWCHQFIGSRNRSVHKSTTTGSHHLQRPVNQLPPDGVLSEFCRPMPWALLTCCSPSDRFIAISWFFLGRGICHWHYGVRRHIH